MEAVSQGPRRPPQAAMEVRFRDVDPFDCWIWLRFAHPPGQGERNYVEAVFDSWFVLGKLGGFNAENLQTHEAGVELSWMAYEGDEAERALPAFMHNLTSFSYQAEWARCWVDMGTSDAIALDVLINALSQLDRDVVEIVELVIGGQNDDWPLDDQEDSMFALD